MISIEEKVQVYERLLHKMQLMQVCHNREGLSKLLDLVFQWSYSSRQGNGEKSEEEIEESVTKAFLKIKECVGG